MDKMSVFGLGKKHPKISSVWLLCVSFVNGFIVKYSMWNIPFCSAQGGKRDWVGLWLKLYHETQSCTMCSFFSLKATQVHTHTQRHHPYRLLFLSRITSHTLTQHLATACCPHNWSIVLSSRYAERRIFENNQQKSDNLGSLWVWG